MRKLADDMFQQTQADIVKERLSKDYELANERSGSLGYGGLTGDPHTRISNVRNEIVDCIPHAIESVQADIAESNRKKIILALTNFLGATFGILKIFNNNFSFFDLTAGSQLLVTAQLAYGYGYVAPFALEYEDTNLGCGIPDFKGVSHEYQFIEYGGYNTDKTVLKFYAREQANKYKKALYCIVRIFMTLKTLICFSIKFSLFPDQ